jgi:hypothetical protein
MELYVFTSARRSRPRRFRAALAAAVALGGVVAALCAAPASGGQDATAQQQLPSSYEWSSSAPLITPHINGAVSVKDPSVVQDEDGTWHVLMTHASTSGDWSLAQTSFDDWSQADAAPQTNLETASGVGSGYRAAPNAFYFEPTGEWYLVYQTGLPSFSTTTDINDPSSWSAPRNFQDSVPEVVQQNIGNGYWLDFHVICDEQMCYLFSADDNGHLYRAETTVEEFPNGFDNTQIALQDTKNNLFEGPAVYKVGDTGTYLLLMEAIGSGGRYYRAFTSDSIDGQWQPLTGMESDPFAGASNVTYPEGDWTNDVSHGELIRSSSDQTMTIDPCNLQLLYQGVDPSANVEYSQLPYRLGIATQTNSTC